MKLYNITLALVFFFSVLTTGMTYAQAATSSIDQSSLEGHWKGVAVCGREATDASGFIAQSEGKFVGLMNRSGKGSQKFQLIPVGANQYKAIEIHRSASGKIIERNAGTAKLVQRPNLPPALLIPFTRSCPAVIAMRHSPMKGLGGVYASADNLEKFCKRVFESWTRSTKSTKSEAQALKAEYSELLPAYDADAAAKNSLFSDRVFIKYFGKPGRELTHEQRTALDQQFRSCVASDPWDGVSILYGTTFYGIELFEQSSVIATQKGIFRNKDITGANLKPNNLYARFLNEEGRAPPSSKEIIGDIESLLNDGGSAAVKRRIAQVSSDLSRADVAEVRDTLTAISQRLKSARVASNANSSGSGNPLARRAPSVMGADHIPGHILLAAPFGHYTYVRRSDASPENCRAGKIPIRVQLNSLLPLTVLSSPNYPKRFFFYAFKSLEYLCEWPDKTLFSGQVSYYFDGKVVAEATVSSKAQWGYHASNIRTHVKGMMHPAEHPDFVYDKAFALMMGGMKDEDLQSVPDLTIRDIEVLAQRGDIQALTTLGLKDLQKLDGEKDRDDALNYNLSVSQQVNAEKMQQASNAGSIVASYLLAMRVGIDTGLVPVRVGQKPASFSQLTHGQQNQFVHLYAKAALGEVFWYRFLKKVVEESGIDISPSTLFIGKNGFVNSPEQAFAGLSKTTRNFPPTEGQVGELVQREILKIYCNKGTHIEGAARSRSIWNMIVSTSPNSVKQVEGWCQFRIIGGYFRLGYPNVENLTCQEQSSGYICRFTYRLSCQYNSELVNDTEGRDPVCRVINSLPNPASGRLERIDGGEFRLHDFKNDP